MSLVIDANMKLFAERLHITSTRMIRDYGLSKVDEIIEEEAKRGNSHAIKHAHEYYSSPEKLIDIFKLADVENKYVLLSHMDELTRLKVLPLLEQEDLTMGLYFFTQEKLLKTLMKVDINELVNVVQEAFPLEKMVMMLTEEDLAQFFMNKDLEKEAVVEQMYSLPPEVMQKFIEGITGQPSENTNGFELIKSISELPDDKFKKFTASIDPDVQRQLTYQLLQTNPDNMTLFENETYVNMFSKMMKPDMIKPMIMLEKETLMKLVAELPKDLLSIVAAQVDTKDFAKFLQKGHMKVLEEAWMI